LALPHELAITNCLELGIDVQLRRINARLAAGLRLIQVREPGMARGHLESFLGSVLELARTAGASVLLNADIDMARRAHVDGVHLSARQVAAMATRPDLEMVGASSHDRSERESAERLGVEFVLLGSVLPTLSHPDIQPLGWERFEAIAMGARVPVFALGGLNRSEMEVAWRRGAHGIAMQRAAWL
jgi:8-oxo-dGTP diphosphatase